MSQDNSNNELYIYDEEGVQWFNPFYTGKPPETEFTKKCREASTDEEQHQLARELRIKVANSPNSNFINPWKGGHVDEWIKHIMMLNLYSKSSMGKEVSCPFCNMKVPSSHFKTHPFIFERGCIFCDAPMKHRSFREYWHHIGLYHRDEVINYK